MHLSKHQSKHHRGGEAGKEENEMKRESITRSKRHLSDSILQECWPGQQNYV